MTFEEYRKYHSWFAGDSVIKRSLAVVGYYILGMLILYAVVLIPMILILGIASLFE
jgi:hypothetical protein